MENFNLNLAFLSRMSSFYPPVNHIAYRKEDFFKPVFERRQAINFGIVLSSGSGRTGYRIGDRLFEVPVPAFVFTCPGPEYCPENSAPVEKLYFSYSPDRLDFFDCFSSRPECVLMPFRREFNLAGILKEMFALCENVQLPGNADRLDRCCMHLIQEMALSIQEKKKEEDPHSVAIYQIASYLDLHFSDQPDIEQLAEKYGMSYRNFLRYWKRLFDCTPGVYLRRRQLDEACRLLQETDLKIYEIAARTGFADPYYFIRMFHRSMNLSPNAYRKRCMEQQT